MTFLEKTKGFRFESHSSEIEYLIDNIQLFGVMRTTFRMLGQENFIISFVYIKISTQDQTKNRGRWCSGIIICRNFVKCELNCKN